MEKKSFTYYAFISYSHKDQKIAKKLQKWLEHYRLPSTVLKSNSGFPKKLSPIFIDESDLGGGTLETALQEKLDNSNYLILICSPNSAKSEYVNDEVNYFIKLGKVDHIIPLIIDGVPNADDPSIECFPPAILALPKEKQILGINLKKLREKEAFIMKKFAEREAFIRVIATLLELDFEAFRRRDYLERIKKTIIFSSVAAVLAVAAGIAVWYNIPHYRYYHTYVYRWEKPVGLFEIKSEADRKKMGYVYRFTTLRGDVKQIERINSAGILVEPSVNTRVQELPMIRFVSDGVVEFYDRYGRKVFWKQYTKNMQAVDFYCGDDIPFALPAYTNDYYRPNAYDLDAINTQKSGNIIRQTLEYDKNGYVMKKMFRRDNHGGRDRKGTPAQDEKGVWGVGYTYDKLGRVIEVHNLDKDGKPMGVHGVYSEITNYGDSPYPIKTCLVDKNGNLVLDANGYAVDIVDYDEYSNIIKWSCYGVNEEPVLNKNDNIFHIVRTYDPDNGFVTSESYYDTNLSPCVCSEGFFRIECQYNDEGRRIEETFYDVNGKRTVCSNKFSSVKYEYNDDGQETSRTFFDVDNKPTVESYKNVYCYRYFYENKICKRRDFVDADGNLMTNSEGCASYEITFDPEVNRVMGVVYKDKEGKRVLTSYGNSEVRYTHDDGNVSSYSYYDENGKPVADASGVARYVYDWKDGKNISMKCFDETGKLTMNSQGYARVDYEYDENGLKTWERYYDSDGKRIVMLNGYSALKYTYDSSGKQTSITYYDAEDNHAIQTGEYYCYAKEFDYYDDGNLKYTHYIREKNNQYQNMLDNQVEYRHYEYDSHGNETKRYWLNSKGEQVDYRSNPHGHIIYKTEYDSSGRRTKRYFYKRGEEEAKEIHWCEYDSLGREVYVYGIMYENDNKNFIGIKKVYDNYGRVCQTSYIDDENKLLIPNNKGFVTNYAIKKVRHDIFGYETDVWYYDENEKPMFLKKRITQYILDFLFNRQSDSDVQTQAFHTVKTYDSKGNVITESYYDDEAQNDPIEISRNYFDNKSYYASVKLQGTFHKILRKYDAFGHDTELYLYDVKDNLKQKIIKRYNSFGQVISIETFNSDEKPMLNDNVGAFRIVFAYDIHGKQSDVWYFGIDGSPCKHIDKDGDLVEHHRKCSYDVVGKILSNEIFDTEGKPDSSYKGNYKIEYVYNSYGLLTEEYFYYVGLDTFRKKIFEYDSNGKQTGVKWETHKIQ